MTQEELQNLRAFVSKMDEDARKGFLQGLSAKDRKEFLREFFKAGEK